MKANTVGELLQEGLIFDKEITGTTPFTIVSPTLYNLDGISFQPVTSSYSRTFAANGTTDNVVSATKTWTFHNGNFTAADVGATFTVTGSVADNGTYTITSVTDANTVVSTEAVPADETFTTAVTVVLNGGVALHYSFSTVAVSDDFVPANLPSLDQIPNAGDWANVTSKFADTGSPFFPALAAQTTLGTAYWQMYPLLARAVQWTVTPTSGQARFRLYFSAKGNR